MGHDGGVADQLPPFTFVVVSGPPASGKTTLARAIAPALGLPLVAKDTIKEAATRGSPSAGMPNARPRSCGTTRWPGPWQAAGT